MAYQPLKLEELQKLVIELKTSYPGNNPQRLAFFDFFESLVFPGTDFYLMSKMPPDIGDPKYNEAYVFIEESAKLLYLRNGQSEEVNIGDNGKFRDTFKKILGSKSYKYLNKAEVDTLITLNGGHEPFHSFPDNAVLMGVPVFELEAIRKEPQYKGNSPRIKQGYLSKSGSNVFTLIEDRLSSEKNQLNDDECLIYLFKLYEYIKNLETEKIAKLGQNKDRLVKQIHEYLKAIKNREKSRIELLAYGTPKLEVLQKKILEMMPNYQKATSSRWFSNSKRISLLEFITLINKTIKVFYSDPSSKKKDNDEQECAYTQSCNVLLGILLFALISIEKEYKFLSPLGNKITNNGSELFKSSLDILNAKSLKTIDIDKKITWLKALSKHIDDINNKLHYKPKELRSWLLEIDKLIVEQEIKKNRPSRSITYAAKATGYAVQCGVSFGLAQVARTYALPVLSGALVTGLTGVIGLVIYSATGLIVMTGLGRFVSENLMPPAVAYVFTWVLEKIGKEVANKTEGVATYTFVATKQGFQKLIGHPAFKREDREFIYEWINTLLKLPDDIVSEKEKNQIRSVLGIENEIDDSFILLENDNDKMDEPVVSCSL